MRPISVAGSRFHIALLLLASVFGLSGGTTCVDTDMASTAVSSQAHMTGPAIRVHSGNASITHATEATMTGEGHCSGRSTDVSMVHPDATTSASLVGSPDSVGCSCDDDCGACCVQTPPRGSAESPFAPSSQHSASGVRAASEVGAGNVATAYPGPSTGLDLPPPGPSRMILFESFLI